MSWFKLARDIAELWQNERTRLQLVSGASILAGIGAGIASYAVLREPLHVSLDHLTVRLPNSAGKIPANGLRLLHLSDTHFRGVNWREQAKIDCIRKACAGLEYDLLIHTGDFLHHDSGLPNVLKLLDVLPAPRLGGYAVFGNHDYSIYSHGQMLPRAWANFQALQQAGEPVGTPIRANGNGIASRGAAHHNGNYHNGNYTNDNYTNGSNGNGNNGNGSNGATDPSKIAAQANLKASPKANGHATQRATPLTHARTLYQFSQYCANVPLDLKRTGMNDFNALEAALASRKVHTLHNRSVHITNAAAGIDIYLAGVDDLTERTPELHSALCDVPYDAPTILLSHNPDILAEPGVEQADLVLSGHTHGGQVVLPILGAAHTQTNFLHRSEVAGYLSRGKTQVYITRGVGEGIPLRLGAAPQITLITLLPA